MKAFHPIAGSTVQRTVTGTSANVAIPAVGLGATAVRVVFTAGTAAARIRSGVGNTTAAVTLTDVLLPNPGTPFARAEVFSINPSDTYMAAITDAGTCTVEFTFGYGLGN
jgi:hypothetical protein